MKKNISEYKAVILDVDGTLYSQPRLRLYMAASLALYYLCHPFRVKELIILNKYRSVRENWLRLQAEESDLLPMPPSTEVASIEVAQYQYVAKLLNVSPEQVKNVVLHWIHAKPLTLLPKCKDTGLAGLIERLHERSAIIAVYSDYPAKDKLKSLDIQADFTFCSSDADINCMKPQPRAMNVILKKLNVSCADALMIGDRFSKDGMAAKNIGMDYIILTKSMPSRYKLYRTIL